MAFDRKAWRKEYDKLHPEKRKARKLLWQRKNADKVAAYNKKWRENHPEQAKRIQKESTRKWRLEHPDVYKAGHQKSYEKYYAANKERLCKEALERRNNNIEKYRERGRIAYAKYYKEHREEIITKVRAKRAAEKKNRNTDKNIGKPIIGE